MITSKKKAKVGDMQDRLSSLPDAILTHILSFLKTKDAVRTCILSRRWKSVWASVPTLNLSMLDFRSKGQGCSENGDKEIKARLLTFLDRVLMSGNEPSFEKIAISGKNLDPYHIKSWIGGAIKRNVRDLEVMTRKCFANPPCRLTQSLFSGNKLVVLKLGLDMVLYFPMTCPCFPNLKVLQLDSVFYKDGNSAQNLLSSCPVLEDLVMVRKVWDNLGTLNVNSRSLKRLSLRVQVRVSCVEGLTVDAPALESIDIEDIVTQEYVMRDLSSIIKAKLNLSNFRYLAQTHAINYGMCLFELLRRISNVKCLTLSSSTMKGLSQADYYFYSLPTFQKLTSLEIFDENPGKDSWRWKLLVDILKSSPVLENLIFQGLPTLNYECGTKSSQWEVPNCLVSHLETLKFHYDDAEDDFERVTYFPENPKVKENMTVRSIMRRKNCWRFVKKCLSMQGV